MKKVAPIYGEIHYIINISVFLMVRVATSVVVKTKEVRPERTGYGDQGKRVMIPKKEQDDVILSKRIIVALKAA